MSEHRHSKMDSDASYLGIQHLPDGKDIIVQIKSAGPEAVRNPKTNSTQTKRVVRFEGDLLPWICNETNRARISKLYGPYYDQWDGKKIQLFMEPNTRSETGYSVGVRDWIPEQK